jgi:predicted transcriptional regulator YheO
MITNKTIFKLLKQMADAFTFTFGDKCEVVIHDLKNIKQSIVYITGNVTNRVVGTPVSDVVIKKIMEKGDRVEDQFGFKSITDDGRELKSSTLFIRDDAEKVVAAFCINLDVTDYLNAIQTISAFAGGLKSGESEKISAKIAYSVDETVDSLFEQAVEEIGKRPATMTTNEKVKLVKSLEDKGAFQIKGVVNQVAIRLGVSNFTVYNYLKKIRATAGSALYEVIN